MYIHTGAGFSIPDIISTWVVSLGILGSMMGGERVKSEVEEI